MGTSDLLKNLSEELQEIVRSGEQRKEMKMKAIPVQNIIGAKPGVSTSLKKVDGQPSPDSLIDHLASRVKAKSWTPSTTKSHSEASAALTEAEGKLSAITERLALDNSLPITTRMGLLNQKSLLKREIVQAQTDAYRSRQG